MKARILIVTSGPLCRHPRIFKEASALGEAGFSVTVLAPAYSREHEELDREMLRGAPFRKEALDFLAPDVPGRAFALACRARVRLAREAVKCGIQSAWALGPAVPLRRLARRIPAELSIVHTELGFSVGARLLDSGRRVAADFEDWHSRDLLPAAQGSRPLRLIRALERRMLRDAAYVTATSRAMATALAGAYGGREPSVLRNVFPLQAAPATGPRGGQPSFFWFSQTLGPGRMLELFTAAWNQMHEPSRLCLLGDPVPGYREALLARIPQERRDRVEFLATVPPAQLPEVIARHDFGLAIEPPVPDNKQLTISNKLFQYLNASLGVIASDTAGQREALAAAPGAGLIVELGQTADLARILDELARDPARRRKMGEAARRACERELCWEKERERLLAAVQAALALSPQ